MSLFKVTTTTGKNVTVNAAHVVLIHEETGGASLLLSNGEQLGVKDTYRSVRGYVAKGLAAPASKEVKEEA